MSQKVILISALLLIPIAAFLVIGFFSDDENVAVQTDGTSGAVSDLSQVVSDGVPQNSSVEKVVVKGDIVPGKVIVSASDGLTYILNGSFGEDDMIELDKNFYRLFSSGDPNTEWYDILYDEVSGNITIYLYQEPLREAREKATRALLEKLDTPPETLCTLNINVFTNEYINPEYTGFNLGLSFCPNGVVLP